MRKVIEGFDNYEIDTEGRVYNNKTGRELRPRNDKDGYLKVVLCKSSKIKNKMVHRLVAQTFLENPHEFEFVDHKDRNKQNNNVNNLRFCSRTMNDNNRSKYKNNTSGEEHIRHIINHGKDIWEVRFCSKHYKKSKHFPYTDDGLAKAIEFRDIHKQIALKIIEKAEIDLQIEKLKLLTNINE